MTRTRTTKKHGKSLYILPVIGVIIVLLLNLFDIDNESEDWVVPEYEIKVLELVAKYPHDSSCFTQGLFIHEGFFYESCGLYRKSKIQKVEIETGKILQQKLVDDYVFSEGISLIAPHRIWMLTYREKELWEFDIDSFELLNKIPWKTSTGEGWGMSSNGSLVAMTDGSSIIEYHDMKSGSSLGRVRVRDPQTGKSVHYLNELEFIGKYELLANVYGLDSIARIDSRNGLVVGWYDLSFLRAMEGKLISHESVFNGIAVDLPYMYVTGKHWDNVYKVRVQ